MIIDEFTQIIFDGKNYYFIDFVHLREHTEKQRANAKKKGAARRPKFVKELNSKNVN